MVRTNPDGRTHIWRTKIVTTMPGLPASGLDQNGLRFIYDMEKLCVKRIKQRFTDFSLVLKTKKNKKNKNGDIY